MKKPLRLIILFCSLILIPAMLTAEPKPDVEYQIKERLHSLFPLPGTARVGSLHKQSALTSFDLARKSSKPLLKRYLKTVSGGNLAFLPLWSEDEMAYIQTRRLVVVRFRSPDRAKGFEVYHVTKDFGESLLSGRMVDVKKRIFLLEIENLNKKSHPVKELRLYQLKDERVKLIENWSVGSSSWSIQGETLFVWNSYEKGTLYCRTLDFKKKSHPLCDFFNGRQQAKIHFSKLYAHPTLPVIIGLEPEGYGYIVSMISWKDNKPRYDRGVIQTPKGPELVEEVYLSPDGQYLAVQMLYLQKIKVNGASFNEKKGFDFGIMKFSLEGHHFFVRFKPLNYFEFLWSASWTGDSKYFVVTDAAGKGSLLKAYRPPD